MERQRCRRLELKAHWNSEVSGRRGPYRTRARQVWDIFPLAGNTKTPRDKNWRTRSYSARDITEHSGNCGIRLTDPQVVLDIDPRNKGDASFKRLCADLKINSSSWPRVKTGGGGGHYYLTRPGGVRVRGKIPGYAGIDVKHVGGYIVAAGSTHPETGKRYLEDRGEFGERVSLADAPEAPAGLVELIRKPDIPSTSTGAELTADQLAEVLALADSDGLAPRDRRKWTYRVQGMERVRSQICGLR
jgi:Mesyanzhinovviridae bifunctional DNA primase/polymerase